MPYQIVKRKDGYYVYKEDGDGRPTGEAKNNEPYQSRKAAMPYLRALYAAERQASVKELAEMSSDAFEAKRDDVFARYHDLVNMGADELEAWADTDASKRASVDRSPIARNLRLLRKSKDEWTAQDVADANRTISFISRMRRMEQGDPVNEDIPYSKRDISLKNWAFDPKKVSEMAVETAGVVVEGDETFVLTPDEADALEMDDAANVSELAASKRETVRELTAVSAFKGKFPSIPDNGVDMNALTDGDDNPVFVTLPILEIGRVSKNGLLYDKALVESVVAQINKKRVGGIFGHIPDEERSTAFPIPNALWIGAVIDGNKAYGKAYIRDRATAEYVRQLKAVGGKIGTSIYGSGVTESESGGARRLREFVLESLDFAPSERASLQMSGEFELTKEMAESGETMNDTELKAALSQMSADALYGLLGDEQAAGVAEMYAKKSKKRMVAAEMVSEMDNSTATITELTAQTSAQARELNTLRTRVAEFENREFEVGLNTLVVGKIDWKTANAQQEQSVNALRHQLRTMVVAELDGKRDLVLAAAKANAIMESDGFRPIAEAVRNSLAGGAAITGGQGKPKYENLIEALDAKRERI